MDNLVVATSLAFVCKQPFVVHSNDGDEATAGLRYLLHERGITDVVEIDVKSITSYELLVLATVSDKEQHPNNTSQLHQVVVWRNMDMVPRELQRDLVRFLDELALFDTNHSRLQPCPLVSINGKRMIKPEFMMVVAVIEVDGETGGTDMLKSLKEKFLFSHFYLANGLQFEEHPVQELNLNLEPYLDTVKKAHQILPQVFQSHEINAYIYSLVVHIRNHRLSTISQFQTRLKSDVMDKVSLLSKAIIVWKDLELSNPSPQQRHLFVTPEKCKVAMRKIGYWLVAWQDKGGLFDFKSQSGSNTTDAENARKSILNILAGEWYGSEYEYAKQYLLDHQTVYDTLSNTGFTNPIVEESILAVKPPI